MKRIPALLLALMLLVFLAAGCGQSGSDAGQASGEDSGIQIASAWIKNGDDATRTLVVIDLKENWSVEFAAGAFYMCENMQSTDDESTAMGVSLAKEVYDEYMEEASQSDSYTELDNAVMYKDSEDESTVYLFTAGENGYFRLSVNKDLDGDAVFSRISIDEVDMPLA